MLGRFQGVKGKKCTTSSPLTPLHLRGVAKPTEAETCQTCQGFAKQPRSGLAFTGWRRPNASVVRVQEVFPCTPATWRTRVGQRPRCWQDPWGRAVGEKCAVGTHFKGFGLQGTEPALCSLAWLSGDRWAHVGSVAKAAPCALRPLSLDNLQVLVQSLLWPLAEPSHPKLGLSLCKSG